MKSLQEARARIAAGNYDHEIIPLGDVEMSRLVRNFNRMAQMLHHTEQLRKEQLANVAHELRTPLTAIRGYTETLRDGMIAPENQEDLYTYILDETRYVTTLVTSLRDWSNTTAMVERLHPELIPVDTLMRDIRARFVPTANTKGIELEMRIADQPLPETGALPDAPIVLADSDAFIATVKTATAQAVSDGSLAQDRAD